MLQLLETAEKQHNEGLRAKWFLARANPEVFQAMARGANEMAARLRTILTETFPE